MRRLLTTPLVWQIVLVVAFLAAWQWIPQIPNAAELSPALDPFFISSPERVAKELWTQMTGSGGVPTIWPAFFETVVPALLGTLISLVLGAAAGLLCSNWSLINRVSQPFLIAANALPRVVLIPIIILIAGSSVGSNVTVAVLVVFFLVFFNAYEGGRSVSEEMMQNATLLGVGPFDQLKVIRFPYVLAWSFAQLPNAITFGLTAVVTAEIFTGSSGLGQLMTTALNTADADLMMAVAVILGTTGVALVLLAASARDRVLHWW